MAARNRPVTAGTTSRPADCSKGSQWKLMREHNRQAADDTKGTNRTAVQFNWLGTSCPPPPGRTTTPGPRPQRCPQRWLLHKALQLLIPGRFLAPTSSNHVASRADSNGIRCAGAEIDQPLFVSFNSWVLRMVQLVSVLSLPTQLNYCSDLLKAVLFGPCQRLGLHLTGSRGGKLWTISHVYFYFI